MCIFSHTFYCCYKPLHLHWAFAVLWSFLFFFFFFFISFSFFYFIFFIILLLIFQTYYIFSTFIPLFAFPTVLFPWESICNVYKSSSTSI